MRNRIAFFGLAVFCLLPILAFGAPMQADSFQKASALLQQLTAEERVGQLFLVTYKGKDITSGSDIYQLISKYHIGGVILERENGNWHSGAGEAEAVLLLTNGLQQIESDAVTAEGLGTQGNFIPLFISLSEEGNGYPYDQLATDLTQLPSEMSLGGTWQTDLAQQTGRVLGKELSLLGINMLLGPSLDVLERPNPGTTGDLGVRAFGGDPFWVGQMGSAYISGIQEGSNQRLALIATHFPGIGGSDRSPAEEVATIRKSLEDLRQIDLAPFASVAVGPPGSKGIIDGLLVSHIRYQGLQGNIHASTRPVSLDPQALGQLMNLPEFLAWRQGGGITVSDSLGTQSVRNFYDPTGLTFPNRLIALNAFQAGNDILQLSNFLNPELGTELDTITDTINFFQQKYKTDKDFAEQVDQAVLRILSLKYRLYPNYSIAAVRASESKLPLLGTDDRLAANICKESASLLSPALLTTGETGIEHPTATDRILILTDSRQIVPCAGCAMEMDLSPSAFANTILKLYGPGASGLVQGSRLWSFSMRELYTYLQGESAPELDDALASSTVIVALIRDSQPSLPESRAFQDLLAQRADIIRKKKVFVFALDAPYYLDSTEISKVYAYYALYSKTDGCIETAARILFGEFTPMGASPVSIDGIGYSLLSALSPNPDQVIQITVTLAGEVNATSTPTLKQTPSDTVTPQGYSLGNKLTFSAGPVLDHNQHPVPNGTVLRFRIEYPADNIPPLFIDVTTTDGIAQTDYVLDRKGELQVSATSEPATKSTLIKMLVGDQPAFITAIAPTSQEDFTPTIDLTVTSTPAGTPTPRVGAERSGSDSLFAAIALIALLSGAGFAVIHRIDPDVPQWRFILGAIVGGLTGFDYVAIGLPGADWLVSIGGQWIGIVLAGAGSICGMLLVWRIAQSDHRPATVNRSN